MTFNDWNIPVDYQQVYAVMAQINRERPLQGGRVQEVSKNNYPTPLRVCLRKAREQADQLIERNQKGERK